MKFDATSMRDLSSTPSYVRLIRNAADNGCYNLYVDFTTHEAANDASIFLQRRGFVTTRIRSVEERDGTTYRILVSWM